MDDDRVLPYCTGVAPHLLVNLWHRHTQHQYTMEVGEYAFDCDIPCTDVASVYVLPGLVFRNSREIVPHADPMPLFDYLIDIPAVPEGRPQKPQTRVAQLRVGPATLANHPWLADHLGGELTRSGETGAPCVPPLDRRANVVALDDGAAAAAFDALAGRRRLWELEEGDRQRDFVCVIPGTMDETATRSCI